MEELRGCDLEGDAIDGVYHTGLPVFLSRAPALIVRGLSPEEGRGLHLWLRARQGGEKAVSFLPLRGLLQDGRARFRSDGLVVELSRVISSGGWFEVSLRQGLRSARFVPVEFVLSPEITVVPPDWDRLYHYGDPPSATISGESVCSVTVNGAVVDPDNLQHWHVVWRDCPRDCSLEIHYPDFAVPLSWRVSVLRGGLSPEENGDIPSDNGHQVLQMGEFKARLYKTWLRVDGRPNDECEILVGQNTVRRERFDRYGRLALRLEGLLDAVVENLESAAEELPGYTAEVSARVKDCSVTVFEVVPEILPTERDGVGPSPTRWIPLLHFVRDFQAESHDGDAIRLQGEPVGQEVGDCLGVLWDLLHPWGDPVEVPLPPLSNWRTGVVVEWPAKTEAGLYRLDIYLEYEGTRVPLRDHDGEPLAARHLWRGSPAQVAGLISGTGFRHRVEVGHYADQGRDLVLQALGFEPGEWPPVKAANLLVKMTDYGLHSTDQIGMLSTLVSRFRGTSQWDELWTCLLKLLRPLGGLNRDRLVPLAQVGCNPARLGPGTPEALSVLSANPNVFYNMWAPLGIFGLRRYDNGLQQHFSQLSALESAYGLLGAQVEIRYHGQSLLVSPRYRREPTGWAVGDTTLQDDDGRRVVAYWKEQVKPGTALAWFSRGEGSEGKPCFLCNTCNRLVFGPTRSHGNPHHPMRGVTDEDPVPVTVSQVAVHRVVWSEVSDRGFYSLVLGQLSSRSRLRFTPSAEAANYRDLLGVDGHRSATKEWYARYIRGGDGRTSLSDLVRPQFIGGLRRVFDSLLSRPADNDGSVCASGSRGLLRSAANEFASWSEDGVEISNLEWVIWVIAALNRLAARDERLVTSALMQNSLRMLWLDYATAKAMTGCPLLLDRDLCWTEIILSWFNRARPKPTLH